MQIVKKREIKSSKQAWPCKGKELSTTAAAMLTPMERITSSMCPETIDKGMPYTAFDIKDGKTLKTIRCNPRLAKMVERLLLQK